MSRTLFVERVLAGYGLAFLSLIAAVLVISKSEERRERGLAAKRELDSLRRERDHFATKLAAEQRERRRQRWTW